MALRRCIKIVIGIVVAGVIFIGFVQIIPTGYVGVRDDDNLRVVDSRLCIHGFFKPLTIYPIEPREIDLSAETITPQGNLRVRLTLTLYLPKRKDTMLIS